MSRLPDGVTEEAFSRSLEEWRGVLGADAVIADEAVLRGYADSKALADPDARMPAVVLVPENKEQIAAVLKVAEREALPLWMCVNGVSAFVAPPPKPGYVVLDLKRMNRVLEVNEDLAYCRVEAGVTFRQLHEHLRAAGSRLWVDPPASPDQAIADSFADHGVGSTPYTDHFLMQCGMEVMLADGLVVKTGMGAMPKSTCWQLFKFGYGPWIDGAFTQSNFGIVTQLGVWLMPQPPGYKPFMVSVPKEDDLGALMDMLRPLKINMVVPNGVAVSHILYDAAMHGSRASYQNGSGRLSETAIKAVADDMGLGVWNLYGALYGLPNNVDLAWEMVRGAFASIPGARVSSGEDMKDNAVWTYREGMMRGVPSSAAENIADWAGGGLLRVSPTVPVDGEEAMRAFTESRAVVEAHDFDYLGQFSATWRAATKTVALSFDREQQAAQARACAEALMDATVKAGYGHATVDPGLADKAAEAYDWNNHALMDLTRRVKMALDPQGILSPGLAGIWPASSE